MGRAKQRFVLDYIESERWTIEEPAAGFGDGWTRKMEYSFTDRGVWSRMTLINPEGKPLRYHWNRSQLTKEKLLARGVEPKITKRRKGGKKVRFK